MKSGIATAVQEQVFEFEALIADLKQQKSSVSVRIDINTVPIIISYSFDTLIVCANENLG